MPIRIFTQNLYNGRADPESFAAALREHSPDVVAVQELSANCAQVLEDWGSTRILDPRNDMTGMGLACRGNAELSRLEFPNRRPARAILVGEDWGDAAGLEVINAHLVNPIARPVAASLRLRRAEIATLEQILSNGSVVRPRILVGDLNSSPAWPVYRRLRSIATDAARAAGTARRTWGPWPNSPRLLRIDHAFVQGIRSLSTQLVNVAGTDHCGLVVDLEVIR